MLEGVRSEPHLKLTVGLPFSGLLFLAACTVQSSAPSGGAPETQPPAGEAKADASSSADGGSPVPSTVPTKLVGRVWSWVTTNGAHQLTFAADRTYTSDVFLDGHPGESCGTEYFTRSAGTASFTADVLTLRSDGGTRTKKSSCSATTLSEDVVDPQDSTYRWRLEDDGSGAEVLVLVNDDGLETSYTPEGP